MSDALSTIVTVGLVALLGIGALLLPRKTNAASADTVKPEAQPGVQTEAPPVNTGGSVPRGIRNNNPGNIEDIGIAWDGLRGNDGRYCIFVSPVYGIRAMMIDLHTGFVRDGEDTLSEIITEWAPPGENNTRAYILSVSRETGYGIYQPLTWRTSVISICKAIVKHENGYNPYPDSLFEQALQLTGRT